MVVFLYVVSIWSMFVFLIMLTLYPDGRLTGSTKTSRAAKVYWRQLNSKRSFPVLEWTSESEYFERFKKISITLPLAAHAWRVVMIFTR